MSATAAQEPFELFESWYDEAKAAEPGDPEAMTVATATPDGRPSARMVLLKGLDDRGFVFYSNTESRKGVELLANRQGAILFHWKSLRRQVRAVGAIEVVSDEEADAYFGSRARGSQIGAWASDQSRPLESRLALEKRVAKLAARFGLRKVPRPPHWTGFRLIPEELEFWRDGAFRLHHRLAYYREGDGWRTAQLYP